MKNLTIHTPSALAGELPAVERPSVELVPQDLRPASSGCTRGARPRPRKARGWERAN